MMPAKSDAGSRQRVKVEPASHDSLARTPPGPVRRTVLTDGLNIPVKGRESTGFRATQSVLDVPRPSRREGLHGRSARRYRMPDGKSVPGDVAPPLVLTLWRVGSARRVLSAQVVV